MSLVHPLNRNGHRILRREKDRGNDTLFGIQTRWKRTMGIGKALGPGESGGFLGGQPLPGLSPWRGNGGMCGFAGIRDRAVLWTLCHREEKRLGLGAF